LQADERVAGVDRYETSVRVAERFFGGSNQLSVATGGTFSDALAGSALSARTKMPLLLVSPAPTPATYGYVRARLPALSGSIVYGSTAAVPPDPVTLLFT
jgi:hypothetical protein